MFTILCQTLFEDLMEDCFISKWWSSVYGAL